MEGWLYLATLIDLKTRGIVGWSMGSRNDTELVLAALEMAVARTGGIPFGHHSDRGSTYAGAGYRQRLARLGIKCSMSRRANCWDNVVAESFFSALKVEWLDHHRFLTRGDARAAAFDYIEVVYSRQRRHSSLGYLTPEAYARRLRSA
jgi:putative transposase